MILDLFIGNCNYVSRRGFVSSLAGEVALTPLRLVVPPRQIWVDDVVDSWTGNPFTKLPAHARLGTQISPPWWPRSEKEVGRRLEAGG